MGDVEFQTDAERPDRDVRSSQGYDAVTAAKKALAMAYFTVQSQAGALSFKNSFLVMSVIIACLSPLPFIMRRPKYGERQPSSAAH